MPLRWTNAANARRGAHPATASSELRAVGVPLARIVSRELVDSREILFRGTAVSPAAERFRRLKAILSREPSGGPQVIVVTSAIPGDGKSFVAMNLALAFAADASGTTLLIDADLRRPALDRYIAPAPTLGLSDLLEERVSLEHTVLHLKDSTLELLPAGSRSHEPAELLSSGACRELFTLLRTKYEKIIVDTPPALPFTDADIIGRNADGALLVVRQGATPRAHCHRAVGMLSSVRVLGAVLNDSTQCLADRGHDFDKYYRHYDGTDGDDR